jgi:hypothetical protein
MTTPLLRLVSGYLGFCPSDVRQLAKLAPTTYRSYKVPKRKGGERTIFHPTPKTKALQYALVDLFLSHLPVHTAARAYLRGKPSPLLANARTHSRLRYTIRLDITSFFPSIRPDDLWQLAVRSQSASSVVLEEEDRQFLRDALFVRAASVIG